MQSSSPTVSLLITIQLNDASTKLHIGSMHKTLSGIKKREEKFSWQSNSIWNQLLSLQVYIFPLSPFRIEGWQGLCCLHVTCYIGSMHKISLYWNDICRIGFCSFCCSLLLPIFLAKLEKLLFYSCWNEQLMSGASVFIPSHFTLFFLMLTRWITKRQRAKIGKTERKKHCNQNRHFIGFHFNFWFNVITMHVANVNGKKRDSWELFVLLLTTHAESLVISFWMFKLL